jgi:hypothetical protein
LNQVDTTNFTKFNIFVNLSDIIITLAFNKDKKRDKVYNSIGKIMIIKENQEIDLFE